jgi:hypothetical protein
VAEDEFPVKETTDETPTARTNRKETTPFGNRSCICAKTKDRTAGSSERSLIGRATELQSLIFAANAKAKPGIIAICGQFTAPKGSAKQR